MSSVEERLRRLEGLANALEGRPSGATVSIPHNDSWLFEDNVDGTHPANLRYVIAATTQKVVSARLSIYLAPYRTYSDFSATVTGNPSVDHTHASANHGHTWHTAFNGAATGNMDWTGTQVVNSNSTADVPTSSDTPANTGGASVAHTHIVIGSSSLAVTEGAIATGVSISFDGVDRTAALGGPFTTNQIELNVRQFISVTQGAWHVIAMQPTGLGRIEAHLRLGVYVSAGQVA